MKLIHRQKPCGLVGDTACMEFKQGDIVSFDIDRVTCPKCKKVKCKGSSI